MISKFSPFHTPQKEAATETPKKKWSLGKKKHSAVPGTVTQTSPSHTLPAASPSKHNSGGKVAASEYFTSVIENVKSEAEGRKSPTREQPEKNGASLAVIPSQKPTQIESKSPQKDSRAIKLEEFLHAPFIENGKTTNQKILGIIRS